MARQLLTVLIIVLGIAVTGANAAGVEFALGGWQQSISGTLGYEAITNDDIIDLEDDMDFDDETALMGRIKIDMPAFFPNLYLVGAPMSFEGNGSKDTTVNFGDTTFDVNADLEVDVTLNQYDLALYYGLPFVRTASAGVLNIDIGVNARFIDLEARLKGESSDVEAEEEESLALPIPMLYLAFQIMPTDWLAFEFEGRGIAVGDNSLLSLVGRVRYNFAGPVFVAAGYRSDMLDIDEDDVQVDADFAGPFFELGFKF